MEKNTARIGAGDKRLLGLLVCKLVARPIAILFFCCTTVSLYGKPSENLIELTINDTDLSIDREFEIEVTIKRETPYLQKNNGNTPRFILEQKNETAELIQSSAIPERDGLHLRYRYRFNKTGRFRFKPELQWKQQTVELTSLDITVHRPPLSEHTSFIWKLYSSSGLPIAKDAALEQGTEYILCLTAAFYSAGYTERYLQALQTASEQAEETRLEASRSESLGSQENRNSATIRDIHTELPLPAEIVRIECAPSESAALKPLTLADMPFDASVLAHSAALPDMTAKIHTIPHFDTAVSNTDGTNTAVQPKQAQHEDTGGEHYTLAIFSLIPLRIGVQSLPQAQIHFAAGSEVFSAPAAYLIERLNSAEAAGNESADGFTAAAFQHPLAETHYSGSVLSEQEKSAAAKQIADYRKQEAASLFSPVIRRKREALEATLGIAHPLPLYPRLLGVTTTTITGLVLIGAAVCGLRNKKRFMLLLITPGLCCGYFTAVMFRWIRQSQGVYTGNSENAAVRRIPENTGSSVYRLSAGESVIIIRKAQHWYYIKTAENVTGWVSPQSLIQYN